MKAKFEQTRKWFNFKGKLVRSFNGEKKSKYLKEPQLSWSAGFTHFVDKQGNVKWCGTHYFEEHAKI